VVGGVALLAAIVALYLFTRGLGMKSGTPEAGSVEAAKPSGSQPAKEAAWKPLFTPEWLAANNRGSWELVDGVLHTHVSLSRPQPSADCAIRAHIQIRDRLNNMMVFLQATNEGRFYALSFDMKTHPARLVVFYRVADNNTIRLESQTLKKEPEVGDKYLMELRAEGSHLIGKLDGVTVIEMHDERLKAAGNSGIGSSDGWFETVEVQSLDAVPSTASNSPAAASRDKPFVNTMGMKFVPVPIVSGPSAG
jgi:hypothetical protein